VPYASRIAGVAGKDYLPRAVGTLTFDHGATRGKPVSSSHARRADAHSPRVGRERHRLEVGAQVTRGRSGEMAGWSSN